MACPWTYSALFRHFTVLRPAGFEGLGVREIRNETSLTTAVGWFLVKNILHLTDSDVISQWMFKSLCCCWIRHQCSLVQRKLMHSFCMMIHECCLAPQRYTLKALIKLRVKCRWKYQLENCAACESNDSLVRSNSDNDILKAFMFLLCFAVSTPWQIWGWVLVNLGQVIQADRTLAAVAVTQIFLTVRHDKRTCFWGKCLFLFKGSQIQRICVKHSNKTHKIVSMSHQRWWMGFSCWAEVLTSESRRVQGNTDLFFLSSSVTLLATPPYKNNHLFYGNIFITLAKQRGLR